MSERMDHLWGFPLAKASTFPKKTVEEIILPEEYLAPLGKSFWRVREIQCDITGREGFVSLHGDGSIRMPFGDWSFLVRSLRYERQEIGRLRQQLDRIKTLAHELDENWESGDLRAAILDQIDDVAGEQPYPKDL